MPAQIFVFYSRLANELMLIYRKNAVISLKTSMKRHESLAHINSSRGIFFPVHIIVGTFFICRRCRNQKGLKQSAETKICCRTLSEPKQQDVVFETEKTIHDAVSEPRKQTKMPCRDPKSKLKYPAETKNKLKT